MHHYLKQLQDNRSAKGTLHMAEILERRGDVCYLPVSSCNGRHEGRSCPEEGVAAHL